MEAPPPSSDRIPCRLAARNPVRICRSEIGKLACQAESVQIFASGEIPGGATPFIGPGSVPPCGTESGSHPRRRARFAREIAARRGILPPCDKFRGGAPLLHQRRDKVFCLSDFFAFSNFLLYFYKNNPLSILGNLFPMTDILPFFGSI